MLPLKGIDDRIVHYYARIVNWLKRAGPIVESNSTDGIFIEPRLTWPHRLAA